MSLLCYLYRFFFVLYSNLGKGNLFFYFLHPILPLPRIYITQKKICTELPILLLLLNPHGRMDEHGVPASGSFPTFVCVCVYVHLNAYHIIYYLQPIFKSSNLSIIYPQFQIITVQRGESNIYSTFIHVRVQYNAVCNVDLHFVCLLFMTFENGRVQSNTQFTLVLLKNLI